MTNFLKENAKIKVSQIEFCAQKQIRKLEFFHLLF